MKNLLLIYLLFLVTDINAQKGGPEHEKANKTIEIDLSQFLDSVQHAVDITANDAKVLNATLTSVELEMEVETEVSKEGNAKIIIKGGYKQDNSNTSTITYTLVPNPKIIALKKEELLALSPDEVAKAAIERLSLIREYNDKHKTHSYSVNELSYAFNFKAVKTASGGFELTLFKSLGSGTV